jgi:phosphate transport system permease protein
MSTVTSTADTQSSGGLTTRPRLPRLATWFILVATVIVAVLLKLLLGWSWAAAAIVGAIIFNIALPTWSVLLEGRRTATDRLVTSLIWTAFGIVCVPLVWIIGTVLDKGIPHLTWSFLSTTMRNHVPGPTGGIAHALVGTLVITFFATLISVPIGLMCAIYLVEYGRRSPLARSVTFFVDVMTGIPSIVAGLFALSLFVLIFGPAVHMAFIGSVALALLMIPTVVRSTEEMLRLVPSDLREAAYALGVPKWRTILKVVVPTSIGGIVTGVMLAISRVIGETAPLLVAVGYLAGMNWNAFQSSQGMATLPTFIFDQYAHPDVVSCPLGSTTCPPSPSEPRYWAAALVLIIIVMVLNLVARLIGKIFAPKTGR